MRSVAFLHGRFRVARQLTNAEDEVLQERQAMREDDAAPQHKTSIHVARGFSQQL